MRPTGGTGFSLLPTPTASDAFRRPDTNRARTNGRNLITAIVATELDDAWDTYRPAIRRWEALTRLDPEPTELNKLGGPRVNIAFVEWMMGWPVGWVTDLGLSRQDQLWMIGNGVVPQQAATVLAALLLQNATGDIMDEPS